MVLAWYSIHTSHCHGCCCWTWQSLVRVFSDVLVAFLYFDIGKYQNMEKPLKHQRRLGLGKTLLFSTYQSLSWLLRLNVANRCYSPNISFFHGCYFWMWQGPNFLYKSAMVMTAILECLETELSRYEYCKFRNFHEDLFSRKNAKFRENKTLIK